MTDPETPLRVVRLEFEQPDGRWTGPYCAEYMTSRGFEVRDRMIKEHKSPGHGGRRFPDSNIFAANPGVDRYVCACRSLESLQVWFGAYFKDLLAEGGSVSTYEVSPQAVAWDDGWQIVYQQRQGVLVTRTVTPLPSGSILEERFHPDKVQSRMGIGQSQTL